MLASDFCSVLRPTPHYLAMDGFRSLIMPRSMHSKEDRNHAYRIMHFCAELLLSMGRDVIVEATYFPRGQREAIEAVARRTTSSLFIIECWVTALVASARFRTRSKDHPGIDLTEQRVWNLAAAFDYFYKPSCKIASSEQVPYVIDTTCGMVECVDQVVDYVESGQAVELGRWSRKGDPPSVGESA